MNPVFPLGMSSYALRWSIQWQDWSPGLVLHKAAEVGAQVVQICDNLAPEALPEPELRDLAALAADLGLGIELGATGCTSDHLRACLRAASLLNAPILRMVVAADLAGRPAELENTIRTCLPELLERGVCLAIENHFDLSPRDLKQLVETIASPMVGICLDVFNSIYHLSSPVETLALLAPYAITVHVKDVDLRRQNTGFYLHGCRLGTGRFDLEGLLAALQPNSSTPALLIESWMDRLESKVETCAQEESWLRDGIQYLKQNTMMEVP